MRFHHFACLLTVTLVACMDEDGVHHLPDAPALADAAVVDSPPDAVAEDSLAITFGGNGAGRVTSSPDGAACTTSCASMFPRGTRVTLTAEPDASSEFAGWTGACTGTVPVCELTLEAAATVSARFTLKRYEVTIEKTGPGTGTVTGSGIGCGATCAITVDHGTTISLHATPTALSHFVGWGAACAGSGACDLTITSPTAISAVFALDELSLVVTRGGNGDGAITSAPAGIACGSDCDEIYAANQMVALTATPATSSTFTGWAGACTGTGACSVTMDAAKAVTGTFRLRTYALTVQKSGTGTGVVTSSPAGIACGADCTEELDHGTEVTLTATASANHRFTGWSGACAGTGPCVVTMDAAKSVTAAFAINTYDLTVATTGSGSVTGPQITCPGDCTGTFAHGTMVTLAQTAGAGYTFAGWGGACSGTGPCIVTMDAAKSVTATFAINSYDLTVATVGMGTVTAPQIACPGDCTGTFAHGTTVTLAQAAATGYTFTGWGGACTGTGACTVTMDAAKSVIATFELNTYDLTVATIGTGRVTAPQIDCPGDCTGTFGHGTLVTLVQTAGTGYTFSGWSGACSGTGACVVTMDAVKSVTATFLLDSHDLTVAIIGAGSVTAPQIDCPGDCTGTFPYGTLVTLAHAASTGSTFTGWSGACSGTGACTVTMDAAKSVTATFTLNSYNLTVATVGAGTVTAAQIMCPTDCTGTYPHGTLVTLAQAATTGYTFTGWSGACTGTGACVVTMDMAKSVTATFTQNTYNLGVTIVGSGSVTAAQIMCPTDCTGTYPHGTLVTLAQAATTGYTFTGWSGACTGTGACVVTMDMAKSVTATFTQNSYNLDVALVGSGRVTGTQIDCPTDCTGTFTHGTLVTLAQAATTGYTFTGWSGACTGIGACTVTMDGAKTVTATFTQNTYNLDVAIVGSGRVTGTQIDCPTDCTGTFAHGLPVTLTASPGTGQAFTGWSGACTGSSTCVVTMDGAKAVTATFAVASYPLVVRVAGNGSVTSSPAGISSCTPTGGTCSASYVYPTMVTLTATQTGVAGTASVFAGWSGACAAYGTSPTCVVTMTGAANAQATFAIAPNILFATSGVYPESLGGVAGADNTCQNVATLAGLSGTGPRQNRRFVAFLSSTSSSAASRIGAASGWVRTDGAPVFNTLADLAAGTVYNNVAVDERATPLTANLGMWTGSLPNGQVANVCTGTVSGGADGEWMGDPHTADTGTVGFADAPGSRIVTNSSLGCGLRLRLLCLGVDRTATVAP